MENNTGRSAASSPQPAIVTRRTKPRKGHQQLTRGQRRRAQRGRTDITNKSQSDGSVNGESTASSAASSQNASDDAVESKCNSPVTVRTRKKKSRRRRRRYKLKAKSTKRQAQREMANLRALGIPVPVMARNVEVKINSAIPRAQLEGMISLKDIFGKIDVNNVAVNNLDTPVVLGSTLNDEQVNRITGGLQQGEAPDRGKFIVQFKNLGMADDEESDEVREIWYGENTKEHPDEFKDIEAGIVCKIWQFKVELDFGGIF